MNQYFKRVFRRYHIGDNELPLSIQSDGILVTLQNKGYWFSKTLGRAIVKNFSAGGAGLVAPHSIKIPRKVVVIFPSSVGIEPQQARVVHAKGINPSLFFYGIEWVDRSGEVLKKVQERYGDRLQ